jgi:hypothetical protein
MASNYISAETLAMQSHPECNEKWVQTLIADNPSLLGSGNLVLRGNEKRQIRAGRLDLLLEDSQFTTRYEVELQLGATDPSHIIRSIEYWDFERRRYPNYNHVAVIVAEEITSRFFNVISLFNQAIPIIAIKVAALKVGQHTTLTFTKVLDIPSLRADDSDGGIAPVDRKWWEDASSAGIMNAADLLLEAARQIHPATAFKFNKAYIATTISGSLSNFFALTPQKRALRASFHLEQSAEWDKKIDESGIERISYDARWRNYELRLTVPSSASCSGKLILKLRANSLPFPSLFLVPRT